MAVSISTLLRTRTRARKLVLGLKRTGSTARDVYHTKSLSLNVKSHSANCVQNAQLLETELSSIRIATSTKPLVKCLRSLYQLLSRTDNKVALSLREGYIFTRVCLSTGGGVVSQHALQVSRPTPKGELEGSGRSGLQTHTQEGGLQAHTWRGSPGQHLEGVSRPTPRGCIPACTEAAPPPADGYCCGRYASYWNAFLLSTVTILACLYQRRCGLRDCLAITEVRRLE